MKNKNFEKALLAGLGIFSSFASAGAAEMNKTVML